MSSPRHRSTETRNSSTKVRIWLLISLAFSACAFGKGPLEVVSYYVSKEHAQVRFARLISTNPQDVYSNEPLERMPEMKVLEKAPFKSRFFNDGDEIYDASPLFDPLIPEKTSGFSAVLNKSAGRLVVRGKAGHQFLVKAVLVRRDVPVQVRGKFDVYLLPPGEDVMSVSNLEFLPKGWRKLSSSTEIGYSDFREPLEAVGIDFKEGDSAILFPGRGVLIVQANPSQLELVHAVCLAAGVGPPRDIKVFVGLVESGSDSDIEKLTAPSVSLLAHGVASLAPGQLDIYSCKSAGQTSRFEVAAQIGARDDIVDLRLEGEIKIGGDKPTEFKTGLTLRSGETVVFSKNKVGGKWRALVVRAEIREALDELPE